MPVEAQWETPFRLERQRVSEALRARYDGTPILASMGSLGHYMQESSTIGLGIGNFVHEGNGDLWMEAIRSPRRSVRWILLEERLQSQVPGFVKDAWQERYRFQRKSGIDFQCKLIFALQRCRL